MTMFPEEFATGPSVHAVSHALQPPVHDAFPAKLWRVAVVAQPGGVHDQPLREFALQVV